MSLLDQLNDDLKAAMLARDDVRKRALRSVKTAIANALVEKRGKVGPEATLDDEEILGLIAKQAKQRRESIVEYQKGGRDDLVAEEAAELAVLESYLPRQLSREEITEVLRAIITEVGASSPRDMGAVMRTAMARLRGRADGSVVNQIARELLGSGS